MVKNEIISILKEADNKIKISLTWDITGHIKGKVEPGLTVLSELQKDGCRIAIDLNPGDETQIKNKIENAGNKKIVAGKIFSSGGVPGYRFPKKLIFGTEFKNDAKVRVSFGKRGTVIYLDIIRSTPAEPEINLGPENDPHFNRTRAKPVIFTGDELEVIKKVLPGFSPDFEVLQGEPSPGSLREKRRLSNALHEITEICKDETLKKLDSIFKKLRAGG